jgi:hypothetical protein
MINREIFWLEVRRSNKYVGGVTSFGDELTGDFCDGFEAISIGDFGLFYRLAGKIVSRILGLLQQYRPKGDIVRLLKPNSLL